MRAVLIDMPHACGRPQRRRAAHRSLPHAGMGCRRRGDAGADRADRRAAIGRRRAGRAKWSSPRRSATSRDHHRRIFNYEAAHNYAYEHLEHRDQVSAVLLDTVLDPGPRPPDRRLCRGAGGGGGVPRAISTTFSRDVDVLLTPSAPGEAPEGLGSTGDPRVQLDLDAVLGALRHPAGRHRARRACRSACSSSASASPTKSCSTPPPGSRNGSGGTIFSSTPAKAGAHASTARKAEEWVRPSLGWCHLGGKELT